MVAYDSSVRKICFIIISHVNTNLKVNINCCLAGCSLKQKSDCAMFLNPFIKE